jgi:hypothetical protein
MVAILPPSVLNSIQDLVELVQNPVKWVPPVAIIITLPSRRHHTTGPQDQPTHQHDRTDPAHLFVFPPVSHHILLGEIFDRTD